MRSFISFELPLQAKKGVLRLQQEVAKFKLPLRFTSPKLAHITLAFFADLKKPEIALVGNVLEEIVKERQPIEASLGKIGCFPSIERAHMVYIEVAGDTKKIEAAAKRIRKGLEREQIDFDHKPFLPHITLARSRKVFDATELLPIHLLEPFPFILNKITLNKSELTRQGPVYTVLKTALFD